jgi:hypothetical protein
MTSAGRKPAKSAKAATWLLGVFLVAILAALGVTIDEVPEARGVALASVVPIIISTVVFIIYSKRGRSWAYAGGATVGAVGVALRVVISTQPSLEVGGGLPVEVTALYLLLGGSVTITNLVAALETRRRPGSRGPTKASPLTVRR